MPSQSTFGLVSSLGHRSVIFCLHKESCTWMVTWPTIIFKVCVPLGANVGSTCPRKVASPGVTEFFSQDFLTQPHWHALLAPPSQGEAPLASDLAHRCLVGKHIKREGRGKVSSHHRGGGGDKSPIMTKSYFLLETQESYPPTPFKMQPLTRFRT